MTPGDTEVEDVELELLVQALWLRWHADFRHYSRSFLKRRVAKALAHFGCATLSALQERVLRSPEDLAALVDALTVPTTELFRDPEYFQAVREKVVPWLRTFPSVKIWVAGCSTGEEVYSLAIVLEEEGLLSRTVLYATDINPHSLAAARFDPRLVRNTVFADHSLATDEVFSEVQFVSCRNVLIYFDRELQDRAFGLFRDALVHGGLLGLGSKETVRFSSHAASFEPFVPEARIWRRGEVRS